MHKIKPMQIILHDAQQNVVVSVSLNTIQYRHCKYRCNTRPRYIAGRVIKHQMTKQVKPEQSTTLI